MQRPVPAFGLVVMLILACPASARASGPGVHVREAARTLELLTAKDAAWAEAAKQPLALAYMQLGSIAPDFEWAADAVHFGHSKELSYHLVDAAKSAPPGYAFFALGHLTHQASDPAGETFFTPAVFSSAAVGM